MALYAIGDLHLSLSVKKSMHIFQGWDGYVEKIQKNWTRLVQPEDLVVLPGDLSWGMNLEESLEDFAFIEKLPGTKLILKGNHDYWWTTKSKMENFFAQQGFCSLKILHNNHYAYQHWAVCGTRGWINENEEPADAKVLAREASRLAASLQSAEKAGLDPIVFLHYPPIFADSHNEEILEVLHRFQVKQCYYGHIHGKGAAFAVNGIRDGIEYHLISSDYLRFCPKLVL